MRQSLWSRGAACCALDLHAPAITDGVISLTRFRPDDAPVLCAADDDPEMRRRFGFPADFVPSIEHTWAVVARWAQQWDAGERYPFAVRTVADHVLVGGCELWPRGEGVANVSYWTYPEHRRAGFASRAVALLCDVVLSAGEFARLEILTDPDHVVSRRIALRNGFEEVGVRDGRVLHVRLRRAIGREHSTP